MLVLELLFQQTIGYDPITGCSGQRASVAREYYDGPARIQRKNILLLPMHAIVNRRNTHEAHHHSRNGWQPPKIDDCGA